MSLKPEKKVHVFSMELASDRAGAEKAALFFPFRPILHMRMHQTPLLIYLRMLLYMQWVPRPCYIAKRTRIGVSRL